jgi:putative alpha-1,2-mannosidase
MIAVCLGGNETDTMVGYHAVPVVVDASFKCLLAADPERVCEATKNSAMRDERGLDSPKKLGYIPGEFETESVGRAMEYAIDDCSGSIRSIRWRASTSSAAASPARRVWPRLFRGVSCDRRLSRGSEATGHTGLGCSQRTHTRQSRQSSPAAL